MPEPLELLAPVGAVPGAGRCDQPRRTQRNGVRAHRMSPVIVIVLRALEDDELAAGQWTQELAEALYQGDDGAYINFSGLHDGDRIEPAYPGVTLARLGRIKATYDPTNLFRNNDNITAA